MFTDDIAIWSIRKIDRRKPYELRWRTKKEQHSRSFLTRTLADNFRSDLRQAARRGERFDVETGLPESQLLHERPGNEAELSWFDLVCRYVADRWDDDAAKTREGIVDALATATLALLDREGAKLGRGPARAAMRWAILPDSSKSKVPEKYRSVIDVLARHTLPLRKLEEPDVAKNLRKEIRLKVDGTRAAPETVKGRRRKLYTALEHAVELGAIHENPLRVVRGKRVKERKVAQAVAIDPRVVASPGQVEELLTAVTYVGSWKRNRGRRLMAFYAVIYYAGARPSEVLGLRKSDCVLPDEGWGTITLAETRPASERKFTSTGERHDRRGLKQRQEGATRTVPIPPVLVTIVRDHLAEFGTAPDGRVFRTERGEVVGKSMYAKVWREARPLAFAPDLASSPLARVPYDLRHAALSTWLAAGVDATEVAERAGNSVDVLLRVYARCLHGRGDRNNRLIESLLAT